MIGRSVGFICGMTVMGLAVAQGPCDANRMNSHGDQMACEGRLSQQRLQDVNTAFAGLLASNERSIHNGGKPNPYTDDLKTDQRQWRAFTAQDCALQGHVSMSNAAIDIEEQCLLDAYTNRIQVLHQMAQFFGG